MAADTFPPVPHDAAFYEAVGQVVVAAAELEMLLNGVYAEYIGEPYGETIAYGQPFIVVTQALTAIAKDPGTPNGDRLLTLVKAAEVLNGERDTVVHAHWWSMADGRRIAWRRRRWARNMSREPFTLDQLNKLANDFRELSDRVVEVEIWKQ
jgi:hypothetical protein